MGSLLDNLRTSKPVGRGKSRMAVSKSKRVSKISAKGASYVKVKKKVVKPGKPGKGK